MSAAVPTIAAHPDPWRHRLYRGMSTAITPLLFVAVLLLVILLGIDVYHQFVPRPVAPSMSYVCIVDAGHVRNCEVSP